MAALRITYFLIFKNLRNLGISCCCFYLPFTALAESADDKQEEVEVPVLFSHSHDPEYSSHAGVVPGGVNFTFAVPNRPSLISLGVYDEKEHLVKTLAEGKREDEFPPGLNGLLAVWDATLQDGAPAPPGRYMIRGYAITLPDWEGISYAKHPWVQVFGPALAIDSLEVFMAVSSEGAGNGDLIGLGKNSQGDLLFRVSSDGKVKWTRQLSAVAGPDENPSQEVFLQISPGGGGVLRRGGKAEFFDLETGETATISKTEGSFSVSKKEGEKSELKKLSFPGITFAEHMERGKGDHFWALYSEEKEGDFLQLGEFSTTGEFLRRLVNPDDGSAWKVMDFSITRDGKYLFVLSETPDGGMRFSGLQSAENEQDWQMLLDISDDRSKQD
ncbi:MAG: hypothetical protein ACK5NG_03115, partial [Chthoniobacterales bacterium]